jgi:hypothetical protein
MTKPGPMSVQWLSRFYRLCVAMTYRFKSLIVAALLSLTAGHSNVAQAQQGGPPPPPPPGGGQGGPNAAQPPGGMTPGGMRGMSGHESSLGDGFGRAPGGPPGGTPPGGEFTPGRGTIPGSPPDFSSRRSGTTETIRVVPLSDVVAMVQGRFNATAVKTDTVIGSGGSGQVTYRIRLLSADKSRVWTVNVDARTGQVN